MKCRDYTRCWGYNSLHMAICSNVMTMWTKSMWTKPCKVVLLSLICHFIFQNCNLINQPLALVRCSYFAVRVNRNAGKFVHLRLSIYWQLRLRGSTRNTSYLRINMLKRCYSYTVIQTISYGQVIFRITQLRLKFHLGFLNIKLHQ